MCGSAVSPHIKFDLDGRRDSQFFSGHRLRKSKSLQNLVKSEVVIGKYRLHPAREMLPSRSLGSPVVLSIIILSAEVPGEQGRAATLRRRISSVEDLLLLASRKEESKPAMTTPVSQQIGEDHPPAELARAINLGESCISFGEKLTLKSPNEPCVDPGCNGACGGRPVLDISALSTAPASTTAPVAETTSDTAKAAAVARQPSPPLTEPVSDKASAFESAFFTASQTRSPNAGPILPPSPTKPASSLIDSLKTHPSVLGLSNGSSPPYSADGTSMRASLDFPKALLDLEGRRNSCDLGHVAPSSGHLGQGSAAVELFYRLNHARQTVDYVKRQAAQFAPLNCATMDVWEALDLLNTLREYESALLGTGLCDPDMPLLDHAFQTAEACRIAFPEHEWMPIVGLIHGLGKLLAHGSFGGEPQWAVCGESFPVGCRFHPSVVHSRYFQANPDRRRRAYATATGVYQQGCGLSSVCMSWSGAEYLYMVLARNRTLLPPEALFLIRYQKFAAVLRPGQPYGELLSKFDRTMLPMLEKFREIALYKRADVPGRLEGDALKQHYDELLAKYIPQGKLRW